MPNTAPEAIHVAVGVIRNRNGDILIARRPQHLHQGGLWEFPGGKVEPGESVQQALARELLEELGIRIATESLSPVIEIHHRYRDKAVFLDVWWVDGFNGEPHGREGQPLAWVHYAALGDYRFPEANVRIVEAVVENLGRMLEGQRLT